jgi:esterase/lipase
MRRVIDVALMPAADELPRMRAAAAPFLSGPLRDEPRRYFDFLDHPLEVPEPVAGYQRRRDGGTIVGRRFASAYRPYAGADDEPNDTILVEHWTHERQAPRATILALHGFSMGTPRIDAWAMFASAWFARGLDVALLTLPYHGKRTPRGARFSGERFANPDPAAMHEAVRRAVYEVQLVRTWLRAQSGRPVGLLGLSLGGYLSALTAGLVDDLDFVVPMVPPVCIGDLAWRFFSASRAQRQGATPAYSHGELRAMYRVHSPLAFPLRLERRRALIIAGRGDRIVPPEHPHALWEHWGRPAIHWFSGSHLVPFGRDRIVAAVLDHLRDLEIL